MPQLVTIGGLPKAGIKRARVAVPQVCACVLVADDEALSCLRLVSYPLRGADSRNSQERTTTKAVKPAPRAPAAASLAGVRKSMRFLPFDAAHDESVQDERSLNDAADASAWLLESGQLF